MLSTVDVTRQISYSKVIPRSNSDALQVLTQRLTNGFVTFWNHCSKICITIIHLTNSENDYRLWLQLWKVQFKYWKYSMYLKFSQCGCISSALQTVTADTSSDTSSAFCALSAQWDPFAIILALCCSRPNINPDYPCKSILHWNETISTNMHDGKTRGSVHHLQILNAHPFLDYFNLNVFVPSNGNLFTIFQIYWNIFGLFMLYSCDPDDHFCPLNFSEKIHASFEWILKRTSCFKRCQMLGKIFLCKTFF